MKRKSKLIIGTAVLVIPTIVYATVTRLDNLEVRLTNETPNFLQHGSSAVGYNNHSSWWSTADGMHNRSHNCSTSIGYTNKTFNMSGAVGLYNEVNYAAPTGSPRGSFAVGYYNNIFGNYCQTSGAYNDITADYTTTLGYALEATTNNATIVGKYNEDKAGVLFVVGQGDSIVRKNALEVHDDGSVIINQAQGDIDMGGFGN